MASGFTQHFSLWEIKNSNSFIHDKSVKKEFDSDSGIVVGARFIPDSFFIASVEQRGTVRLWNYKL